MLGRIDLLKIYFDLQIYENARTHSSNKDNEFGNIQDLFAGPLFVIFTQAKF